MLTRAAEGSSALAARLRDAGLDVVECPLVRIEPIEGPPVELGGYDWLVLTSARAVEQLWRRGFRGGLPAVAVIGPGTADALRGEGVEPALVAGESTQEGLLAAFPQPPGRVLFAGAEGARKRLATGLGADVVTLYRRCGAPAEVVSRRRPGRPRLRLGRAGVRGSARRSSLRVDRADHDGGGATTGSRGRRGGDHARPGRARASRYACGIPARVITLLSDFGVEDAFAGICHGVIRRIAPEAVLIDITHGIPPQQVMRGALTLADALPYMPTGVHLAVVDPGVGGVRRPVALRGEDGRLYAGPDNGLLLVAADRLGGIADAVEITNPAVMLEAVSPTFHGRDIFAPAAAHLALGSRSPSSGRRSARTSSSASSCPSPGSSQGGSRRPSLPSTATATSG